MVGTGSLCTAPGCHGLDRLHLGVRDGRLAGRVFQLRTGRELERAEALVGQPHRSVLGLLPEQPESPERRTEWGEPEVAQ